ncbi:hypothetical protein [Aeromonas media]|uniref:hypothetical protein n=1 Tax=Aeromonas media TaxID=651 RepID=UPI0011DD701D|nr:hypothetical protein [Aeromonas media]QQQ15207.1 hypothetical protein JJL53_09090 [Aeromonas media]
MAEIIDGVIYESLWHSSNKYRNCSQSKKEHIATQLERTYRDIHGISPPYINKIEGAKHGFPQGFLGYPKEFIDKHLDSLI